MSLREEEQARRVVAQLERQEEGEQVEALREMTSLAKSGSEGQQALFQSGACDVLLREMRRLSDKFKLEEEGISEKFSVGDAVKTVWGEGVVQSHRAHDDLYIVHLNHWKLAQGQSPTLYLGADSMTKNASSFSVGDAVKTVWGVGKVQSYRAQDRMYIVLLDHWKLAQGQSPTLYLGSESMKKLGASFYPGDLVRTVWGEGVVQCHRAHDDMYIVHLNHWKLAQGQSPTLYLGADSMTKNASSFSVGDAVKTVWGVGKVQSYRAQDRMYIVLLDHWKLAQGQSPTLYLGSESMKSRDLEYERKLKEVKDAHDEALILISAILSAVGALMRRSLPKSNSCKSAIESFVNLGFIDLVAECLNKFMHDTSIVNAACWCIMVMCSDDPDNQVALAKAGACEGVMQAMSSHAGNAAIIEYICRAARNLSSNLSIAHHCVGSGIGELIACVIILHMDSPELCEAGLWVVTNLSCDSNNATVLGGIGMCDAITTVLRKYVNNAAVSAAASWTVKNLACGSKFNYSQFIHTDVCNSLYTILQNFPGDCDVLSPTLWAIANITCDPALSLKINENEDICNLVVSILSEFISKTKSSLAQNSDDVVDNLDIVEAAMWALRNIASVGATNDMINVRVTESIHEVLTTEYFLSDESLVDSALATIVNILSNLSSENLKFRDHLRVEGFAPIFLDLMSRHKLDCIMRHASKAICLFVDNNDLNRQSMVDISTCQSAVTMMHTFKRNEPVVLAACDILYALHYKTSSSEVSRLVDCGMIEVSQEGDKTSTTVCSHPFDKIVAAWLPQNVLSETGWSTEL